MARALRGMVWVLLALAVAFAALWFLAPREPVAMAPFDPAAIPADPAALPAWLAAQEAAVPGIRPGAEKQVIWAGAPGARTPWAVVYVHGFSATLQEIRPVPDRVAKGLGANLFFTRLTGHGQDGAALAAATAGDWRRDMAEALAIGARLGDRVLVIATSTGGTLAALAAAEGQAMDGLALVAPNFALRSRAGALLDLPFARHWAPLVAGAERSFPPRNDAHGRWWTTRYPTTAVFPMAAVMRLARETDFAAARVPALFLFSPQDYVIDPAALRRVAEAWGGPAGVTEIDPGAGGDAHVIAGDVLSPDGTAPAVTAILDFAGGL